MFIIALLARILLKIRTKMQACVYGWVLSLGLVKLYYWSNLEKHILLRIEKRMQLIYLFIFLQNVSLGEKTSVALSQVECAQGARHTQALSDSMTAPLQSLMAGLLLLPGSHSR